MKEFFKILREYLPPYKSKVAFNILFNILGAMFGIFSFIAMLPLLRILFSLQEPVLEKVPVEFSFVDFKGFIDALKNNLYYLVTYISENSGPSVTLVYIGAFLLLMVLFKTGFTFMASYYMVIIRNNIVKDLRDKIYKKCVSLPISYFSDERKGDIMTRMTGDIIEIEASVVNSLDMIFKNPIIIIFSVVTMIVMSWQLTLFVFILLPFAVLIIGRIGKNLKKKSMRAQNKVGLILSIIDETLTGLRIIKAFNAEDSSNKRFRNETNELRRVMNKVMWRRQLAHPVSEFLGTLVIIIVMWYGGKLILEHREAMLQPEQFLVYLIVFYSIINPAKAFSHSMYSIQKGLASMDRINKIFHAENKITEIASPVPINNFEKGIEFKGVNFRYINDWVLNDINLTIHKGETVALVGQSGSGKSTMADLIPRFYDPEVGEIRINGTDIRTFKLAELRNLLGIVNQEAILFNDTIFNNIAFGKKDASEEDVMNAAKVANAHEFISQTPEGYQTNIGDRGNKLSGGQRQRISIARAVLKNPPILILDEATSALDTESEKLVQDALNNLMKNRTSVVIAHRLSTIVHANKICVLDKGNIVEMGTHAELLKLNGHYKRFYDLQNFS